MEDMKKDMPVREEPDSNGQAEEFWREFCKRTGTDIGEPHSAWAFCGGGKAADELLALVLCGKKFGTASIYEEYLAENEAVPGEREYSIILDSCGRPACVIRNYDVRIEPFMRVSDYHGFSEGEEERNLEAWRRIHSDYWAPDLGKYGLRSAEECHAVCEKFTLEYVSDEFEGICPGEYFMIEPNMRYAGQIAEYRSEMMAAGSSMDGCMSLGRMPDPGEWTGYTYGMGDPGREAGRRAVLLMCVRKKDDRLVGMIQMRKMTDDPDLLVTGQIGYSVRPSERGGGIAKLMLGKALEFLKYGLGEKECRLSILPGNEASRKTAEACGARYVDTVYYRKDGVMLDRYCLGLDR